MKATAAEIRKGDIYTTITGDTFIATDDARQLGPVGPAADLVVTYAVHRYRAGLRPDGIYELGTCSHGRTDLAAEQPITIHQRGALMHSHRDDVHSLPPAGAANLDAENRKCATRDEARRVAAIRAERAADMTDADSVFRKGVREAVEAGVPIPELMEITGLSRARIYQIRDGRR